MYVARAYLVNFRVATWPSLFGSLPSLMKRSLFFQQKCCLFFVAPRPDFWRVEPCIQWSLLKSGTKICIGWIEVICWNMEILAFSHLNSFDGFDSYHLESFDHWYEVWQKKWTKPMIRTMGLTMSTWAFRRLKSTWSYIFSLHPAENSSTLLTLPLCQPWGSFRVQPWAKRTNSHVAAKTGNSYAEKE